MAGQQQSQQQPTSMLQGLQTVLGHLGTMMAAPDADIQFLTQLQHAIVGKIKQGTQQAVQGQHQQMQQATAGPGGGMGGGMRGLSPQMPLAAAMGGVQDNGGGGEGGPEGTPNPDELRRALGAQGMTG